MKKVIFVQRGILRIFDLTKSVITSLAYEGNNSGKFSIELKTLEGKVYKYQEVGEVRFVA